MSHMAASADENTRKRVRIRRPMVVLNELANFQIVLRGMDTVKNRWSLKQLRGER